MSNPKEFEENAKVPRIGILGECMGLGGRRKRKKKKHSRNNWRICVKGHL